MAAAEREHRASITDIQSDIRHTCGQFGETADALSAQVYLSKAAAKPPLAIVASVAGVTVVGLLWWRRRRRH